MVRSTGRKSRARRSDRVSQGASAGRLVRRSTPFLESLEERQVLTHFRSITAVYVPAGAPANFKVSVSTPLNQAVYQSVGLLLLDHGGSDALSVTGNGSVVVAGTGMIAVDTGANEGAKVSGNGVVTDNAGIALTGTGKASGNAQFVGPVSQHQAPVIDPLQLHLPTGSAIPPVVSASTKSITEGAVTLQPGTYVGGIQISGKSQVTLAPGVYYLQGGGFSASGSSTVVGKGVVLINAPATSNDGISITGNAGVTLTAATNLSGAFAAFNGIALMEAPTSTAAIQLSGNASLAITGTLYAPAAPLILSGNSNLTVSSDFGNAIAGEVIAATLTASGNDTVRINT